MASQSLLLTTPCLQTRLQETPHKQGFLSFSLLLQTIMNEILSGSVIMQDHSSVHAGKNGHATMEEQFQRSLLYTKKSVNLCKALSVNIQ